MDGRRYDAFELCARIHPITAEVLGTYEKDFYAGEAAVTKNRFGRGAAYYIAARTGTDMLAALYGGLIASLGIGRALDAALPAGVTAHERVGEKLLGRVRGKLQRRGENGRAARRMRVVRYR